MPFLAPVKQIRNYNLVIEDPDPTKRRIFIENLSYNVDDLSGRFGEEFQFSYNTGQYSYSGDGANFYDWPIIYTEGRYGNSWADSRQAWPAGIGKWDPWLLSLDYRIIPKRIYYDKRNNRVYVFYPRDITGDNMRQDVRISYDITEPVGMRITTQNDWMFVLYQRDDGALIGFNRENNATYVSLFDIQYAETDQSPASIEINNLMGGTNSVLFFIGSDRTNSRGYFLYYNCSTHNYAIWEQGNPSSTNEHAAISGIGGDSILYDVGTGGYSNICYQFPSNIINEVSDIWIFYSSHWDSGGILAPKVIRWDKDSMVFTSKDCTMNYPGTDTYSDYGAPPTNNNFSAAGSNTWWIKPHVFRDPISQVRYITFLTIEKSIQYYYNERWYTSQQQRNWITYTIDASDNSNLTYHSHVEWTNTWEFPRSWVPINERGDEILVMLNGRTVLMKWNDSTGWQTVNTQSVDARAYGIDSTGRIYLATRALAGSRRTGGTADTWLGGQGYNALYTFDRNTPYNIKTKLVQGDGDTKEIKFEVDSTTYVTYGDEGIFPIIRRGYTYRIDVSTVPSSHPLAIRYSDGDSSPVIGAPQGNSVNGAYGEHFYFTVPYDAPNSYVYQCVNHSYMIGTLEVADAPKNENTIEVLNTGFDYQIKGYTGSFPTIKLRRGVTYYFDLGDVKHSHPFSIRYNLNDTTTVEGVSVTTNANKGNYGTGITFTVPYDAPDVLRYVCAVHVAAMAGIIRIVDSEMEIYADNVKDFGMTNDTPIYKFFNQQHPFVTDHPLYYNWSFDGTDRVWTSNHDDFNFRLGDFTVEFWIWSNVAWSSQTNLIGVVGQKMGDNPYQGWQIYKNNTQSTKMAVRYAGNNDFYSTDDVDTTVWNHWALVRENGTMYWYKNGVQCGSVDASTNEIYDTTADFLIGMSQTWSVYLNGKISNLRICKGLAVYTGNFAVPQGPLNSYQSSSTNISAIDGECVLLTCQNNDLIDNSGYKSIDLRIESSSSDTSFVDESGTVYQNSVDITTQTQKSSKIKVRRTNGDSLANIKISTIT